jgi:hypothetical protein
MQTHQNEIRTALAKHESTLPNISLLKNTKAKDSTHPQLLPYKKKTPKKRPKKKMQRTCVSSVRSRRAKLKFKLTAGSEKSSKYMRLAVDGAYSSSSPGGPTCSLVQSSSA